MNRITPQMVEEAVEANKAQGVKLIRGMFFQDDGWGNMTCACALSQMHIAKCVASGMTLTEVRDTIKMYSVWDTLQTSLDLSQNYSWGFVKGFDNPRTSEDVWAELWEKNDDEWCQGVQDGLAVASHFDNIEDISPG